MLPLWAGALGLGLQLLGADMILGVAAVGVGSIVVVDSALALVRHDGRSLHDLIFDTRVALDTTVGLSAGDLNDHAR